MINVRSVDHVVLRVADVEKVGAFYIDVLGGSWDRRRDDIGLHHLRLGDAGLERAARRVRNAAIRCGDGRSGEDGGGADEGRLARLGRGRR